MPLDALIKFRCEQSLEDRLLRIAAKERRELANLLRIALEDYAAEQERKLGLADTMRDAPLSPEAAAMLQEAERKIATRTTEGTAWTAAPRKRTPKRAGA